MTKTIAVSSISRALLVGALALAPGIATAATNCSRDAMRGTWFLTTVAPGGDTVSCELTFARRGEFDANCYGVDTAAFPPTPRFYSGSGQLRLHPTACLLTGNLNTGTGPTAQSMAVEGWVWSSWDGTPNAGTAVGSYTLGGVQMFQRIEMHRRLSSNNPVFEFPDAP